MKCPYMKSVETHVQIWCQDGRDSDEKTTSCTVDQWQYDLMNCLQEDCAAWHNGRCHYNDK